MVDAKVCSKCGREISADAPAGQCPDCLLGLGLGSNSPSDGIDATVDSPHAVEPFEAPSPAELEKSFPQLEIIQLIGQGGMGAVYKAKQKSLDRVVALKIIKADMADRPGFAERFAREARALARLNHANIVGVHDFGQTDGLFFFVMEYVDGADLRRLIETKSLQPEQALKIVPQVCEALQYAHDQGIVHRDIKPENILVNSVGQAKIADFGLAKLLSDSELNQQLTGTHQVMGTLRYMAPEQMEGSVGVDHRADIYSLGVVLYELLTGELPLGRFAVPSEKASIDNRLDDVVMRALEKELPRRYQHASELKSEIERVSQPEVVQAHMLHDSGVDDAVEGSPAGSSDHKATAERSWSEETGQDFRESQDDAAVPTGFSPTVGSMKSHVTILGVLHLAFGGIFLVCAIFVFVFMPSIGIVSQDKDAMKVLAIIGTAGSAILLVFAVPLLWVGYGLLKLQPWSRIATMILSAFNLMNVPLGTLMGAYAFWVLLHPETVALFEEADQVESPV